MARPYFCTKAAISSPSSALKPSSVSTVSGVSYCWRSVSFSARSASRLSTGLMRWRRMRSSSSGVGVPVKRYTRAVRTVGRSP